MYIELCFSISLEIYLRFEIGRKLENSSKSALTFFNKGSSIADFKSLGISPVVNDRLIIIFKIGTNN